MTIRTRGRLPHWEAAGAIYFVTFRLADSLPQEVLEQIMFTRRDTIARAAQMGREVLASEQVRLKELHTRRMERFLDAGAGKCYLCNPAVAGFVANALRSFDGKRYRLFAWCIMPNHVHVIFQAFPPDKLNQVLHTWKSFTAKEANKLLNRSGEFWQREYFDHLIRNAAEFNRVMQYVINNPKRAGLKSWPWVWSAQ